MQKPVRHTVNVEIMLRSFIGIEALKCAGALTPTLMLFPMVIQFLESQLAAKIQAAKTWVNKK